METKREWQKPVLSVLVRGTSEENVLRICKDTPAANPDVCGSEDVVFDVGLS